MNNESKKINGSIVKSYYDMEYYPVNGIIRCRRAVLAYGPDGASFDDSDNGKWGAIDTEGNEIIPFIYDFASHVTTALEDIIK